MAHEAWPEPTVRWEDLETGAACASLSHAIGGSIAAGFLLGLHFKVPAIIAASVVIVARRLHCALRAGTGALIGCSLLQILAALAVAMSNRNPRPNGGNGDQSHNMFLAPVLARRSTKSCHSVAIVPKPSCAWALPPRALARNGFHMLREVPTPIPVLGRPGRSTDPKRKKGALLCQRYS